MADKKSSDLPVRIIGSIFVAALVIGGIYLGGAFWKVVCAALALLCVWEFYRLAAADHRFSPVLMLVVAVALIYALIVKGQESWMFVFASLFVLLILFDEVFDRQKTGKSTALRSVGNFMGGTVYAVLPWCYLALLRGKQNGVSVLYILFACTWASDVFAYFVGRSFGKNRLCENVSPKKTWEGTAGGAAASFVCSVAGALIFKLPIVHTAFLGLCCGTLGQLGDLAESVLKREAAVKDSGNVIPGHGGVLDRFDSMLVNAVVAYIIFGLFVK